MKPLFEIQIFKNESFRSNILLALFILLPLTACATPTQGSGDAAMAMEKGGTEAQQQETDSQAEKLVEKLHALGDRFAKDMDKASKEFEAQLPEIEKELQSLGKHIGKEVDEAWKKYRPDIEKNLHEFADAINKAIENARKKEEQENSPAPDPVLKTI